MSQTLKNGHKNPCPEIVDGLPCALGAGHLSPHSYSNTPYRQRLEANNAIMKEALDLIATDPSNPHLGQLNWKHIAREALSKVKK